MQNFNVQLALLRGNLHCAAIKKKLKCTEGIKIRYDQDILKRKNAEMVYNLAVDGNIFYKELEYFSRIRPEMVLNPLRDIITSIVKERGITTLEWKWSQHIPELGMYPIAFLFWSDLGTTLYVKVKR